MLEQTDAQLLRNYAEHRDESAFRELVSRHADVVYASALRQVSSPDLAKDATATGLGQFAVAAGFGGHSVWRAVGQKVLIFNPAEKPCSRPCAVFQAPVRF